jgi:hypothetical protein
LVPAYGYALRNVRINGQLKTRRVHRLIYEQAHGPIADGLEIDHECHNRDEACPGGPCRHRRCVNPAHLRAVRRTTNLRASKHTITSRNAAVDACPHGHPTTKRTRFAAVQEDSGATAVRAIKQGRRGTTLGGALRPAMVGRDQDREQAASTRASTCGADGGLPRSA